MTVTTKNINVALVDDHKLFRKGLAELIRDFPGYSVLYDFDSGWDLQKAFTREPLPDIVLLDVNMPEMSGFELALWLKDAYPQIRILALSMNGHEGSIIRMIKAGARGYILKDADPLELKQALDHLVHKGYYHSELVSATLMHNLQGNDEQGNAEQLTEKETRFLALACSELTYKEIADRMNLAPKTIDGYRESLFAKLSVKSRVGLVLYAIKHQLINGYEHYH
ncbi:response regulator transcription factor [Cesiribacter sp. SM1]|uniref:response regulator transcription factor n=1 Tax=Cesiribacter sp. SM1 TaxID=2861196 RepID=UPI001CD2D337|nr:response regulator transcription factor [Cesiribacter sp. SM1]